MKKFPNTIKLTHFTQVLFLTGLLLVSCLATVVHAQTPIVQLTVNGGSNTAISNGQSVTLEWYISGAVSNCSINNGVGPVSTASMPATGSLTVTPPDNLSTEYSLTCNGGSSVVYVYAEPEITIRSESGSTVTIDPFVGEAFVRIEWSSRYATQCTKVWAETASNPGVKLWTSNSDNSDKYQPSGDVEFEPGGPHPNITETSTFFIECSNSVTGTVATKSVTVTVVNGPQPPAPSVDIWSNNPGNTVSPNPDVGWSYADIEYVATGVGACSFKAYRANNTAYTNATWPDDYGDYGWDDSEPEHAEFEARIGETSRFEITCTQPAYTYNGVSYPATSVTDSVTVTVPAPVPTNRSGVPAVTLSVSVLEPARENPLTEAGVAQIFVSTENAEYCNFWAGSPWQADGWWGMSGGSDFNDSVGVVVIATTTLYAECLREYDRTYFSPGSSEYENAYAYAQVVVPYIPSTEEPPEAEAYIYANSAFYDLEEIWDEKTAMSGFSYNSGEDDVALPGLYTSTNYGNIPVKSASVTFRFKSPGENTDQYDIQVVYCDTTDGENDFTLTTESGFSYSWTSDSTATGQDWCNVWGSTVSKLVGTNITLTDKEKITISCTNQNTSYQGEPCAIYAVAAGKGNGATIDVEPNQSTGFATIPVMWFSLYAEECDDFYATPQSGAQYRYEFDDDVVGDTEVDIATTTTLSVTCRRDDSEATSHVTLRFPSSGEVIMSTTTVSTGTCVDPDTLVSRNADLGERANPVSGYCEASVDLAAVTPALNFNNAIINNVTGTYDSLEALITILNEGPAELPVNSDITYKATLDFDQEYVNEFGVLSQLESVATPSYNGQIAAPTMVGDVATPATESPTLTRVFDGVPFGTHELCARVNLDGSPNFAEWNLNPTNNQVCTSVTLPVPPPPMTFVTDKRAIRRGQAVVLNWSLDVTYQMYCTVKGPGGVNDVLNTTRPPSNPQVGGTITAVLRSSGKFLFTCTEELTNTTFTEEVLVEVIPDLDEI